MERACLSAVVVLLSSGCAGGGEGGGAEKESTRYDPTAITRCLKQRFVLVVDNHLRERHRWYGGKMTGQVSVNTTDLGDLSNLRPTAEIGFAENESEAQKLERTLRQSSVLPADEFEATFRRKGNVVIVWRGSPPTRLRERVESCVAPVGSA